MTNLDRVQHLRVAILQHSERTLPGSCTEWLTSRGHSFKTVCLFRGDPLPPLPEVDWLIILGGPMNVDDTDLHPWLLEEKRYLKTAIETGKVCLGLCLGGQLLAQVLGARVNKNEHWEVGWQEVDLEDDSTTKQKKLTVFQWHQDQFALPQGASRLATNGITANQAFRFREHVLGIQFHPESTESWVTQCTEEEGFPVAGPFVQSKADVIQGLQHLPTMRRWFFSWLEKLEGVALLSGRSHARAPAIGKQY